MAVIHPCRHCPHRQTCANRSAAAAAMSKSPLKVTLSRLSCAKYDGLFAPGDRVLASIGGAYSHQRWDVRGTITGQSVKKRGKWVVQVDEDCRENTGFDDDGYDTGSDRTDRRPFVSVYPDRLTKLDEPRREICQMCGNAKGANGEHLNPKGDSTCDRYQTSWLDDGSDF